MAFHIIGDPFFTVFAKRFESHLTVNGMSAGLPGRPCPAPLPWKHEVADASQE
jgi:hypothetical protein